MWHCGCRWTIRWCRCRCAWCLRRMVLFRGGFVDYSDNLPYFIWNEFFAKSVNWIRPFICNGPLGKICGQTNDGRRIWAYLLVMATLYYRTILNLNSKTFLIWYSQLHRHVHTHVSLDRKRFRSGTKIWYPSVRPIGQWYIHGTFDTMSLNRHSIRQLLYRHM